MADKVEGVLEVGCNEQNEVVINHPDLKPDENGVGHIVFSVAQARSLAQTLLKKAGEAEDAILDAQEAERLKNVPPVDRTKRCMTSGNPESPDHRELLPNGQQKDYVVLCPTERAKGFVRPVRRTYIHKTCNTTTTMGQALAETYARDPYFYSGTFCCRCAAHFPLDQFLWEDGTQLGVSMAELKTKFTNLSKRQWSEGECHIMINAALCKLIDDAGGVITISVDDLFRVAPMGTLALSMSDDDKVLTLTRLKVEN